MNHLARRLKIFLVVFIALIVFGAIGYSRIEHASLIDSVYFVIVTMATVGYGDVHPVTAQGKIFTLVLIFMGVGTFLGVVANITEMMLAKRELESRMKKLNMVIGVFYSEVGIGLLRSFCDYDPDFDAIRPRLLISNSWTDRDFVKARKDSMEHRYTAAVSNVDLNTLKTFLMEKRDFLLRLLENPVLLEHQSFTDLLRSVFHLTEELSYRTDFVDVPNADINHIGGDIKRVYHLLVGEWITYMKYLKNSYPFLFSLAVRTNPFDKNSSVIVKE